MPRIIPIQLLRCLKVLLDDNGGILSASEVKRIAGLMTKYSKKLVSKCIYVQILKCTKTDLLVEFMEVGGWAMVYNWLTDSIRAMNWPLVQEILELFLLCPVDVNRLKINSAPKLVKGLTRDGGNESVRILATRLVEQWLKIVTDSTNIAVFTSQEQSAVVGDLKTAVGLPINIAPATTLHNNAERASSLNANISQAYEYPYDEELDAEVNNIINTDTKSTTIATNYSNNSTGIVSDKVNPKIIPIKVKQPIKRTPKVPVAKIVKSKRTNMNVNMAGIQEVDPLADVADISPISTNYTLTPAQKKATEAGLVYKFIVKDGQQILAKVPQNMQKKAVVSKKQNQKYDMIVPDPEPVEEVQQVADDDIVEINSDDEVDEIAIALTTELPDGAVDVFGDIDDIQYNEPAVKPVEEMDVDMSDNMLEEMHNDMSLPHKYSGSNSQYLANNESKTKIDTELFVDKKDLNESLNDTLNDTFKSSDDITDSTEHKASSDSKDSKDREKDRKSDKEKSRKSSSSSHKSSSSSHKSSSKSSSSSKSKSSSSSHRSSSDKYKSSDKERSSSSKDKDKERREGSSSTNSSKQKSSSSKSSSSKDRSRDKEKSSTSSTSTKKDKERAKDEQIERNKETLAKLAPQTLEKFGKIPKKPKEDIEIKQHISITIPSKKASMSIELRPDAEKAKTVKTYNSQFRSHGLTEEAPPPPSRKDLKKPKPPISPNAIPNVMSLSTTSFKRVLPIPQDATVEKKPKISMDSIDPLKEKPGAVKLIPPKRKNGYWFFLVPFHTIFMEHINTIFVCRVYEVIFSVQYFETVFVVRKKEAGTIAANIAANIWATLAQ